MPLLPTDELWTASIAGTDHSTSFYMPMGATEGQARMRAWRVWSMARGGTSNDPAQAVAAQGLTVGRVAAVFAEVGELSAAA